MNAEENISKYYQPLKPEDFGEDFGGYWETVKKNLEISVNNLPELWKLFIELDRIFHIELDICSANQEIKKIMALNFYWKSLRHMRASIKLLFSTQLQEALTVLKMSIESVVIARKMIESTHNLTIWVNQNKDENSKREYNKLFVKNMKDNLFPESDKLVSRLHPFWKDYSHLATHSNRDGIDFWLNTYESDNGKIYNIKYTEDKESTIVSCILNALQCMTLIEKLFYREFNDRLKFDIELERIRKKFSIQHNKERKKVIADLKMKMKNEK